MIEIQQGTPEWHEQRLGKVTASQLVNVMMKPSTSGYQNYASQLICERLTNTPTETFKSAAMEHGNETEPQARAMYELNNNVDVIEVGFINHPTIENTGASPDGLVGDDGLLEIKCPQNSKHIKNLLGGKIDRSYTLQMQWQMRCTERKWTDFLSFNPKFPEPIKCKQTRVYYDSEFVENELEPAVISFLEFVDKSHKKLMEAF